MSVETERVADVATGISWGSLVFSNLAAIDEVIRFFSLLISCASGLVAVAYYIKRLRAS